MKIVSRTLSVHREHELLLKLEAAGLTDNLAQKVIDSKGNELAIEIVRMLSQCNFEATISQERAREIMGNNFFGINKATKIFGVNPIKQQLIIFSDIPFTEEVLEECKETHVLVAVFQLSILDIRDKVECNLFSNHKDAWYNGQKFAQDKSEFGWQLVRKTPIKNSTYKSWPEQQVIITEREDVPTAQVMIYTIIGHYLATGERLFEDVYVRCSDVDSNGHRVRVGCFGAEGLYVYSYLDGSREDHLGLASVIKLDHKP